VKRPARRFVIREQTFGLHVEFYAGTPQAAALRRCAKVMEMEANDPENAPDEAACAWALCSGNWACVWLEDVTDAGSLVHELYHVTQDFLKHIEASDEETGAYLLQYLFREAQSRLTKKPKTQTK
jgi:hypothetical protein